MKKIDRNNFINRFNCSLIIVNAILMIFFALPTNAEPHIKPEIKLMINNIFNNRKQYLIDNLTTGLNDNETIALYNTQLYTQPLLSYAVATKDIKLMDDLADIYLKAYPYLQNKNRYVYYYWTADDYRSIHDVTDENGNQVFAKMWLGTPFTDSLGMENIISSSQFIYALTKLCNGILTIPQAERTTLMNNFITSYVPVILSHYKRWIFSSNGLFQVHGWGGPVALYNHQEFLQALYDNEFGNTPSYLETVTDADLWIIAGVTNMLAANSKDAGLVPIDSTLKNKLLNHVDLATDLIASRMTNSSLTKFDNSTTITGINFELGYWDEHPDYKYSGYSDSVCPRGLPENRADNVAWDIGHAQRFVEVFNSLHQNLNITNQTFPDLTVLKNLTNQLLYGAGNKSLTEPLFTNFMDGCNGWYRVDYHVDDDGHGPYGLTSSILTGGYSFWSEYNSDMLLIRDALWSKINSLYVKDLSGHFRHLVVPDTTFYGNGNPATANKFFTFDGTNELNVGIEQSIATSTGTIEFWFKPQSNQEQDLIEIKEVSDNFLIRKKNDNSILLYISDNSTTQLSLSTTQTVNIDKWNHLAITQNDSGIKIYLNGILATQSNSTYWTNHLNAMRKITVGSRTIGDIDDLHFYKNALTSTEIAANCQQARLIAHWSFDATENCEYNNTTQTTGITEAGAAFNGTNQFIHAFNDQDMSNATGSISLWFKPTTSGQEPLVYIYEAGYTDFLLIRKTADNKILLYIEDGDISKLSITTTESVNVNAWNHLVITQDGAGAKIYLNGNLANTSGTNSNYWTAHLTINCILFGRASWVPAYFQGSMDEIKLYQGTMTAGKVAQEYGNGLSAGEKIINYTFDSSAEQFIYSNVDSNSNGIVCNAATFNGTNQFINVPLKDKISSPTGTISLWFKPTTSGQEPLVYIYESGYTDFLLIRKTVDNKVVLYIEDGDISKLSITTTESVNINAWNHLVITQDGTGAKIYINGNLANTSGTNSNYWTAHLTINCILFGRASWVPSYFQGSIDEIQLYDYAIDQQKVSSEYRRPDMLMGWDFNESQNPNDRSFITTYYGSDFNITNSLNLLMFLPSFLEL